MDEQRLSPGLTARRTELGLCGLAFFVLLSYAIAGTAAQSLFLQIYGNAMLPWVWLAVAGVAAVCTAMVNYFAARVRVVALLMATCGISMVLLAVLLAGVYAHVPGAAFALYVWKDVYVVLLVELFWTFANVAYAVDSASRIYGWFCAAGSVGAVVGNLAVGPLATHLGTLHSLWLVFPALLVVLVGSQRLGRGLALPMPAQRPSTSLRAGWGVLRQSHYLGLLMLLVAVVQITVTVLDFQFSQVLELTYPEVDRRTAVLGQVNAAINAGSLLLQVGTAPLLRLLGVHGTLVSLPVLLGGCLAAFIAAPQLATLAVVKVASKCVDYSIFRTSKEILYIPLSYAEKTQGKALVDMLTYRVAKAGASLLVLGLAGAEAQGWLTATDVGLCACWLGLTVPIVRRYRAVSAAPGVPAP